MYRLLVLFVVAALASGCGTKTVTVDRTVPAPPVRTTASVAHKAPPARQSRPQLNNPAQLPNPSVTADCNEVPAGRACRASTEAPEDPNVAPQRNCDTNIVANSHTSCGLAENAFYEYYEHYRSGNKAMDFKVHSPTTGRDYELGCFRSEGLVGCESSPTSDYIFVDFPEAAVSDYTETQARDYATTRDIGHPGPAAASSTPPSETAETPQTPTPNGGGSSGEDEVGSYSHEGDESFCNEHECIGDFEGEDGYVVECSDGSYSHSGGKSGACSDHGGDLRP